MVNLTSFACAASSTDNITANATGGKSGDIRTPIPESFGQHSDFLRTVIPESFGHFRRVDRNNI